MTAVVRYSNADAAVEIDLVSGCRLSSLEIAGQEILVTSNPDPLGWGSYPMAPYAGRVRDGSFTFAGSANRLRIAGDGHAIHGTVLDRQWTAEDDNTFSTRLGESRPFAGQVRQQFTLSPGPLHIRLEVHTEDFVMPASCGWHPWFRRRIADSTARLDFRPGFMLEREADGIATRNHVKPKVGPWDDCFGDVTRPPSIRWPGFATLSIESTCRYWVVFTERDHAFCVEPQTAPPNDLNNDPFIVEPDRPLTAEMTLRWTLE